MGKMRLKKSGIKQGALLKYLTVHPPTPRGSHGSAADEPSGGSTKSDVSIKPGPSQEKLTRAEEIQLEADRIPSVKTSTWNPFALFPYEMWEKIFGNLTDSKDLLNVINATPEWRGMYRPQMAIILFEQAVTIMANNAYLKQEDYFQCRLVCRSWDQSVQNFIQMHPVHFDLTKGEYLEVEENFRSRHKYASQYWQRDRFNYLGGDLEFEVVVELEKTHPHPYDRNPFLCRQVTLTDNAIGEDQDRAPPVAVLYHCLLGFISLLEKYGKHVWDCAINFRWNLTPLTWYIKTETMINMMQNLKVLHLEYTLEGHPIQRRERNALEKKIRRNPLPELKDLVFLKTLDMPGPVFNELIRKSKNLKQLQVILTGGVAGTRLSHYRLDMMASQNLTECDLTLVCPEDFTHLESTVGSWPLKKLYLHLEYEYLNFEKREYPRWPKWDRTFKAIEEKFGTTLRELKLRLPEATKAVDRKKILKESPNYRLNLPHLEYLRVVVPNLTSFDFLLPLTSLTALIIVVEHLELDGKKAELLKKKEILKFNGNFDRLLETNVWEQLPKLRHVYLIVAAERFPNGFWGSYTSYVYVKKEMKYSQAGLISDSESEWETDEEGAEE